jgi:hypothetical protein
MIDAVRGPDSHDTLGGRELLGDLRAPGRGRLDALVPPDIEASGAEVLDERANSVSVGLLIRNENVSHASLRRGVLADADDAQT